ncbi:hypothetical protein HYW39_00715 [Candidatus Curtissbacteria bacterium]|nr:hypothetical protein [Candidatus Curtissbacteria bacterium]
MDQEDTKENEVSESPPTTVPVETTIHEQDGTKIEAKAAAANSTKIILAVVVLLLLIVGILFIGKAKQAPIPTEPAKPETKELSLIIAEPTDRAIVEGNKVTIKGKTAPKAIVLAYTDESEASVESDTQGNFKTEVDLKEGVNDLVVTSFGDDGQEKSVSMSVVYNP